MAQESTAYSLTAATMLRRLRSGRLESPLLNKNMSQDTKKIGMHLKSSNVV
jgi:hypothetical protein